MPTNTTYQWECQPLAESIVENYLAEACNQNSAIATLSTQLRKNTSTRLFDWVDHIILGYTEELERQLEQSGFVYDQAAASYRVFYHPGAQLPRIVVCDHRLPLVGIAVIADSIADFIMVRGQLADIEGSAYSGYRRCCISSENDVSLWVVERRGSLSMEPIYNEDGYLESYFEAKEIWQTRLRDYVDDEEALEAAMLLADEVVALVGKNLAAYLILQCEREYWQWRNMAGQIQKNRQDRLGMGWANHDHHTFRSSRKKYALLVRLFEVLGFHCRERFYAGQEAGWGAQVMENPTCRLVLFLDVDLAPEEIDIDFAHHPLPELTSLGTIGLWCALHGDSILKAGMHHLEAQFMFDALKDDLGKLGVELMDPFSSLPYLKQAFTRGEQWPVEPQRVELLVEATQITQVQAKKFLSEGAIGSHLENLQRREGFKGFNQQNVSRIIKETDPRSS